MINIYTDGSYKKINNIDYAGYGYYIENIKKVYNKLSLELKTNNRAELYAIIKAIKYCNKNYNNEIINIYTDSEYCIKVFTYYAEKIITSNKNNTLNYDLLKIIYDLLYNNKLVNKYNFKKVKAHSNNINNNIADLLANKGCAKDFINNNNDILKNYILNFGKYKDKKLLHIYYKDKNYLEWLFKKINYKTDKILYTLLLYLL